MSSKMKYLITGGTGFIGKRLCSKLISDGNEVVILSRSLEKVEKLYSGQVKGIGSLDHVSNSEKIDVVINLAGEGIANKKWSSSQKQKLISSRLNITKGLISLFDRLNYKPSVFISASAIGYYGAQENESLTENSKAKKGFTHELCSRWEDQALKAEQLGIRTCITRLGVVLGSNGGTLAKIETPFKLGLGGRIGSGKQYFSWVHIDDVISVFDFLAKNKKYSGIYNLTAPNPVTNAFFTKAYGEVLKRPVIFPMPGFVVKTLFGEMGDQLLLKGQRVLPKKLLDSGYKFKFEKIDKALQNIYKD